MDTRCSAVVSLVLVLGLSACSGASMTGLTAAPSGSSTQAPSGGATPPGGTKPAAQKAAERNVAQSALSVRRELALQLTSERASTLAVAKQIQALRQKVSSLSPKAGASTQACSNSGSATWSITGTVVTFTINNYFDTACTQISMTTTGTFDLSAGTFSATSTIYSTAGAATEYDAMHGVLTVNAIALVATAAYTVGGTPFLHFGLSCAAAPNGSDCGSADALDLVSSNQALGTINNMNFVTTISGGSATSVGTGTESLYGGPLYGLTVAQGPSNTPTWTISGGAQLASLTDSLTETVNASEQLTAFNLTATDAADGIVGTLVENSGGGFTGTLAPTSAGSSPIASFTVDANGNGTIHYADGTTGTITGYMIVS